jgi:hypothetical protein
MDQKRNQNGTTNHPDTGFLRFWGVLEGGVFVDGFWDRKKSAQNPEKSKKMIQKEIDPPKIALPGGMRGASGEARRG